MIVDLVILLVGVCIGFSTGLIVVALCAIWNDKPRQSEPLPPRFKHDYAHGSLPAEPVDDWPFQRPPRVTWSEGCE